MCAGIWWEDLDPFDLTGSGELGEDPDSRHVRRVMPGWTYHGLASPVEPRMREYFPGLFLMLPILRLEIIRDELAGRHAEALERAERANLDAVLVDG